MSSGFIPAHGGYRHLLSYQKAEIVYDLTYHFCRRFLEVHDRTVDQMIQAARSGKQNIAEASRASATSTETEIRLTNVARASLEELRIDYEDFLRVRGLSLWNKDSDKAHYVRVLARNASYETFRTYCETRSGEVVANIAICLIHQAGYLLDQQIRRLEYDFVTRGGVKETMARVRREHKKNCK